MAGRLPKRVGWNVCENTKHPTFSYAGDVKCSTLKSLFVDITHSRPPVIPSLHACRAAAASAAHVST